MKVKIAYVEDLKPLSITYSEQKVICPFCKSEVIPILKVLMTDHNVDGGNLRFLARFPCCNKEHFVNCDKGDYYYESGVSTRCDAKWTSEELPKVSPNLKDFPEIIDEISPSFRQIYEEAQAAEQLGYTQICGGGYRKALEFLIKDYASFLYPEKKGKIEDDSLANCIQKFISNKFIQIYADRASWLGNDELHYRRVWENKDIFDLGALIEASILAIRIEEEGKKLEIEMPKPPKK